MKINNNFLIFTLLISIFMLFILLFGNSENNDLLQIIRIIVGSVFILFLPGYYLTLCFFGEKEIDFLERFALSFALSISIIPLLSFYLNLLGVKITDLSVFFISLIVILFSILYMYLLRGKLTKKS